MIVYQNTAIQFREDVDCNRITQEIENAFILKLKRRPGLSERNSWTNSLRFMEGIIRNSKIADDCGILVEFNIPTTNKRVDFIVTGCDMEGNKHFIIIELKQWSSAKELDKDGLVLTSFGEKTHPSYQAWSYKQWITDMNEVVYSNNITGHACAYLHNYKEKRPEPLKASQYQEILPDAPLFFTDDYKQLQDFIYLLVGQGNGMEIAEQIETGKIKPSKKLMDHVNGLFHGNSEFILLDEQKVAIANIMNLALDGKDKKTIIVHGGPGTGKSVISMNAFGQLLQKGLNVKFVAPNASYRNVMVERLVAENPKSRKRIRDLFTGSGQYVHVPQDSFDALIVDEAHRLKGKGAFQYTGENQVEDIVQSAKTSVFFIDDNQRIRNEDIGTVHEIKRIAENFSSTIYEISLSAQFRCSGADGYLNWVDDVLQIRETGNFDGWDKQFFDFAVMDTPQQVLDKIKQKPNSRMLAGFAWKWTSEKEGNKDGEVPDVDIPEYQFQMPWNARSFSSTWAIHPEGVNQIGCVHTSQGLEFEYVGVIIGNDLKFDPEKYELYADIGEYYDTVGKKGLKNDPKKLTVLIKNIYKILLSRGMKGCYVFCRDRNLQNYLRDRLLAMSNEKQEV